LENRKPILQAGKTEDIEKMAKEWASIIKNKEARKDAEDAARIILEHGIKLPRLLKKKGGKTSGAEYRAPMFEGDDGILYFNELRERDYKSYKEKKMQYRSGAQDNTFLHELGHHIDALLEPKAYSMVEHQWNMEKVNRELIEKELSRYALENRAEFEAELISATLRGKTFSKELLSYSNLHNPEQNEGIAKTLLQYASGKDICTPVDLVREKFDRMMKVLFRQEGANLEIGILASEEAQDFIETHSSVLNGSFRQVEMSEAMRKRLERSNYVFSGLKTFHELNEAFPSLLDENGNRKTFERFLNDVRKIDETYNSNYLRAEFNFVQASAEMAAKWERFMQDGDRYYLQYRTAGDAKVRPTHAEMAGITLPASDPFWEEFYPPNGWGCRCSVVQVRKSKYPATDHEEAMARGESALELDKKGMFRFNAGMEQKTMPDYNPYTIKRCKDCDIAKGKLKLAKNPIPDNELCEACQFIRICEENKGCFNDELYGNRLKISKDADKTEVQDNIRAAYAMLESFPEMVIKVRENVLEHGVKNPEYMINGLIADRKGIESPKGIQSGFKKAIKQGCQVVVIDLDMHMKDKKLPVSELAKYINWHSTDFEEGTIKECYVIHQGKAVKITADEKGKDTIASIIEKLKP
jgi:SPP1 gp7 family putative phage head morphogenesis protein